jgi:hypothetical protein
MYSENRFMEEASVFIGGLDSKTIMKILCNLELAEQSNEPQLFKKLQNEI